jgi:hypothetical protein
MKNGVLVSVMIIVIVASAVVSACVSTPVSHPTAAGTKGTKSPGNGAMVPSLTPSGVPSSEPSGLARPAAGSVQPVDFDTLKTFLPAPPAGWEAGSIEGPTKGVDDDFWSYALESYSSGNEKNAAVTISDSAYYDVADWDTWNTHTVGKTSEGTWNKVTVQGYPAWELDSKSSYYYAWIGVNQRFMVKVVVEGSKTDLDTFVNAIDYPGISALPGGTGPVTKTVPVAVITSSTLTAESGGTAPWSGSWDSEWGTMQFTQSGNQVTATYTYNDGRITGTVSGNTLTGTWSQSPSYQPPKDAGDVVLTMAADRNSFAGNWRYGTNTGTWDGTWTATRK